MFFVERGLVGEWDWAGLKFNPNPQFNGIHLFQLFFLRGNQPASQAMPPTRAKIPKTKAQSRRANGTLMGT
jgi:hypothetical protein